MNLENRLSYGLISSDRSKEIEWIEKRESFNNKGKSPISIY
jgi:hypothetical protein